jgi:dTDP-4-dehydrorhamnose 3,5-epimerase
MIEDVHAIPLQTHTDDRGFLTEIARVVGDGEPHSVIHQFGQVYMVGNPVRGAVRAYHKHDELWDWFFIAQGTAKFVLRDDRAESPTYEKMATFVFGTRNSHLLVVPPGVYHGWVSLEDNTLMLSTASHTYNREQPDETRISPDSFGDVWTVKGK